MPARSVKNIVKELADARALVHRLENELSKRQEECRHMQMQAKVCIECFAYIDGPSDVVR